MINPVCIGLKLYCLVEPGQGLVKVLAILKVIDGCLVIRPVILVHCVVDLLHHNRFHIGGNGQGNRCVFPHHLQLTTGRFDIRKLHSESFDLIFHSHWLYTDSCHIAFSLIVGRGRSLKLCGDDDCPTILVRNRKQSIFPSRHLYTTDGYLISKIYCCSIVGTRAPYFSKWNKISKHFPALYTRS